MPRIKEASLEEHRRNTMNALLDSAETIMREQGSDALTPAAVSRGAGIARNSIYRYVRDMKDLRQRLMERHLPKWVDVLDDALEGLDDPVEIITTWVRVNLEQSVIHGHEWLMHLPVNDAEEYTSEGELWPQSSEEDGGARARGDGADLGRSDSGAGSDNSGSNDSNSSNSDDNSGSSEDSPGTKRGNPRDSGSEDGCAHRGSRSASSTDAAASDGPTQRTDPFCGRTFNADGTPSDEPALEPGQPSLHTRVNEPIVHAWERLRPGNPQVGIALTEGLVSSGMRLLSEPNQTEETRKTVIADIDRSARALIATLSE